jgi:hypothetical protein
VLLYCHCHEAGSNIGLYVSFSGIYLKFSFYSTGILSLVYCDKLLTRKTQRFSLSDNLLSMPALMEPFSIIGGIVTIINLLGTAKDALKWCCSICKAPEHVRELQGHIFRFETIINPSKMSWKIHEFKPISLKKGPTS